MCLTCDFLSEALELSKFVVPTDDDVPWLIKEWKDIPTLSGPLTPLTASDKFSLRGPRMGQSVLRAGQGCSNGCKSHVFMDVADNLQLEPKTITNTFTSMHDDAANACWECSI